MSVTEPIQDECDVVDEAIKGSSQAFSELFNTYYPAIHAYAYRLTLCPGKSADVAQETFIQAAKSLRSFRRQSSFKNWLYTIATHKSFDLHRQQLRRTQVAEQWGALQEQGQDAGDDRSAASAAVRAALGQLNEELRATVTLVYYEGLNHAEAARVLGCAETTVSWRIYRAKQKLKKHLSLTAAPTTHD